MERSKVKRIWAMVIFVISVLALFVIVIGIQIELELSPGRRSLMPDYLGVVVLFLTAFSGFMSLKHPKSLWLPIIVFSCFGIVQAAFILSGIAGSNGSSVGLFHVMALVLTLVALPISVAVISYKLRR